MTPANIIRLVWACVLLTAFVVVGVSGYRLGGSHARVELAEYKAKVSASTAKAAQLATKSSELARKAEHDHAQALATVAEQYEGKLHAIESDSDRRVADVESGALRVRKLWAGCETDRLSDPVARAGELAGQDRLRVESAERVLRAVETLQAQRNGLQAVTEADRK